MLDFRFLISDSPRRRHPTLLLLTGYFLFVSAAVASACPTCKEALFDPAQAQRILGAAKGYALSIGLMIGMPLLLVGGITLLIVRQVRRVDRHEASR